MLCSRRLPCPQGCSISALRLHIAWTSSVVLLDDAPASTAGWPCCSKHSKHLQRVHLVPAAPAQAATVPWVHAFPITAQSVLLHIAAVQQVANALHTYSAPLGLYTTSLIAVMGSCVRKIRCKRPSQHWQQAHISKCTCKIPYPHSPPRHPPPQVSLYPSIGSV